MKPKFTLKVKSKSGVSIEEAPEKLFPTKCMKDCEEAVIKYVKKRIPDWSVIIIVKTVVYTNGKEYTQRHIIECEKPPRYSKEVLKWLK